MSAAACNRFNTQTGDQLLNCSTCGISFMLRLPSSIMLFCPFYPTCRQDRSEPFLQYMHDGSCITVSLALSEVARLSSLVDYP